MTWHEGNRGQGFYPGPISHRGDNILRHALCLLRWDVYKVQGTKGLSYIRCFLLTTPALVYIRYHGPRIASVLVDYVGGGETSRDTDSLS